MHLSNTLLMLFKVRWCKIQKGFCLHGQNGANVRGSVAKRACRSVPDPASLSISGACTVTKQRRKGGSASDTTAQVLRQHRSWAGGDVLISPLCRRCAPFAAVLLSLARISRCWCPSRAGLGSTKGSDSRRAS